MSNATHEVQSTEQVALATSAAAEMDALIGRLGYDESFKVALANNPKEALAGAGFELRKEGLEAYMRTMPERFEQASEALFSRVDSDFLMSLSAPSCDPT